MNNLIKFFAVGLGSGYFPRSPGTAGSFVAIIVAWYIPFTIWQIMLLCLVGVYICSKGERILEESDSPRIVYDEFCGIFISVWDLHSIPMYCIAFILFRCFDIMKPFPITEFEKLPGGWGVMADDIVAGFITRILISIILIAL